jgi:hypothetical protein
VNQFLGAFTRATGIVAAALAVAALVWGFFFSARATGQRLRPAWWLDLHNWLGGLALTFTGAHIVAAWLDRDSCVGLREVFVPGPTGVGWGITWGVIATYLFAVAVFTTWPRRWRNRRGWRVLHLGSVVGVGLALLHSYQSGSDAQRLDFRVGFVAAVAVATYALGLRVFGLVQRERK